MSPERNLLFGLLALQSGFITRDQLVAAVESWASDKRQRLDQLLKQHGAIDDARLQLLLALVEQHVTMHGGDACQSLAHLSSVDLSARQELARLDDDQVQTCLSQLPPVDPYRTREPFATVSHGVSQGGTGARFVILRPHAAGGLGQVAVALDTELHREVALKEIRPEHADESAARTRFLREAEITGGLEHPGIVPVYGLGAYGDGRPYYAMKFVKGHSLKVALDEFHHKHPQPSAGDYQGIEFRQLLRRFLDVCNAMQYAHDRGVLHRDLKPGNIMLGQYGETLVIDWGLAKPLGESDSTSLAADGEKPLITQSSLSGTGPDTVPGSAIGTPHYMSPEQASGQLDDLGPATDVYSLGATLYQILTGQAPATGDRLDEILERVRRADYSAPRQIKPHIPKSLEAVCRKAMSLRREERYATPHALATDLEHWMADEPVSVLAEPLSDRLARVGRKHRGAVTAVLAASLLIAIGSTVAAVMINHQRQLNAELAKREQQEKEKATKLANEKDQLATQKTELAAANLSLADREREANTQLSAALKTTRAELYRANFIAARREWMNGNKSAAMSYLMNCPEELRAWEWRYLLNQCHSSAIELDPAPSDVGVFSPDGLRYAAPKDSRVTVYDATTGNSIVTFEGHRDRVVAVAFSSDGNTVASVASDEPLCLWNSTTGEEIGKSSINMEPIFSGSLSFSGDGKRLLYWDQFRLVVFEIAELRPALQLEGSSGGYFQAACFDASGGQLAIAQDGSNLRIVNILDGATVRELQHPGGTVRCMALSRSPEQLAVWSTDNRIRIWEPTDGKPLRDFEVGPIKQLMFTNEDRWLCGVTDQRTIKTWDAQEWRELSVRPALSSSDSLRTGYAFSNDGNRIASQQQIRLETESGERSILTSDHSTTAVFSPDSQLLAIGGLFGNIELWTVSPLSLQSKLENVHKHKIVMLDFSPDGTLLASASEDGTVSVRTTEDWTEIMRFREHRGALRHLAFAPNGENIVTASDDAEIFVWKPKTGEITLRLDHLGSVPETVGFDRTEKILLAWFTNAVVRSWNYPAGDERYTVGEASAITWGDPREGLRFNPQSGEFAYVEQHSLIALARVNDGSTIRKLGGGLISGFDFAPREPRIAAGQYGSSLEIFDLDGRELLKLQSPGIGSRPRFSPDGSYLACTGQTGAWLWNGTAQPESKDARNSINVDLNAITFDPAHSRITTVGREGVISSWNTTDGQTLSEWIGHSRQGTLAVLSPDGTSEAYLHWDQHGTKLRWNDAGKPDVSLTPAFVPAKSAAISADGTLLAVLPESGKDRQFLIPIGPPSNEIELWDVRSGTRLRVLRGHATNIETVGFSHHGQQLVSRGTNGQIMIWDTETGEHVREFRPPNRLVSNCTFSISADDELIAFPCANDRDHLEFGFQAVSVQKVKTGEQVDLVRFKRSNFFRTFDVQHVKMFSSDHRLMMVSHVGETSQYDMQTKEVTSLLDPMGVSCLAAAFSHDGKRVAIADGDQSISIWNLESRRLEMRFNSHFNMLQTVVWSPDDTTVISGDVTGTTFWWRIDTGEIQRRVLGNRRTVKSAVYSPDGLLLATGGDDSTIRIWDVAQQRELKLLEGHSDWVTGLAIHPDGKLLASASRDQTVRLWSFPSGEPRGVLRGHTDTVRRVKFSPDGSQLASSGRDGELRLWNIDAHTCRLTVSSRMGDLHGLCWSPDSKSLATGAYNGQLAVWNAADGDLLLATEETEDFLRDVAYSPNGRWLASVGDEGIVRMRLAENGATGLTLHGLPRDGTAVGFSPDGKDLYACAGTSLRTWKLPDDALLRPTGLPPSAATTLSARARIAFDAGNYNQAEQEFLVAAAESPDNPMWPWWRGITLTYLSRHRDALVPYDQAVALRGDDRLYPNRNADILFYRGVLKQQLKDAHGAIADFDEAIRLKPQIWSAYNRRGLAYEAQQKFAEALEDFNVAIEHVPEDATYMANRANLHQKMGAFQLAIEDYSQAIERAPANAAYRISRAACYSQLQLWTEAESDYEEAIGLADNDASVWRSRGDYFVSRGEWSRAAQDYESAIERAPEIAELWNGAAVIARKLNKSEWHNELCREFAGKLGDRKVAGDIQSVIWVCCRFRSVINVKELLNDVVAKWPANEKEDGLGSFSHGVFQYRSGDWQAAELSLQKSVDETQAPANFRGLCFLAMSQAMLEQLDRAQETCERAKELLDEIIRSRENEKETSPPSRWVEEFECDELYDEVRQTIEAQGGRLR